MRRVHMKRARTCAARTWNARACGQTAGTNARRAHRTSTRARARAARRPARPRGVISAQPRGNNLRRATETISITHLQDHVVVESKIFNARLHVLRCHVSCGADLVRQQLHSMWVGGVEALRAAWARWDCLLLRSVSFRRLTALRMPRKASTITSAACTPARKHACRTLAAVGSCGTAALHAAALASRMRSDKGNGPAHASGAAAAAADARTPPSCSSWSARWQCLNTADP